MALKSGKRLPWSFIGFIVLGLALIPLVNNRGWWVYVPYGFLFLMIYFKHILAKARMGVYGEEAKKTADAVKPTKHEIKSQKKHEERKAQSEKWKKEREAKKANKDKQ